MKSLSTTFQKLEAVAMFAAAAYFYGHLHFNWVWAVALWLAFDVSMVGYAFGTKMGGILYNVAHSYIIPAVLIILGVMLHHPVLVQIALIEVFHITLDRALGYGLKESDGFQHTHLGMIGKKAH